MARTLDGGKKDIVVAVVIEIGEDCGAAIGNGIDAGNAGDILKFLALQIEEERVALVTTEGETFVEDQIVLIVAERS